MALATVKLYRGSKVLIYGDSITAGHNQAGGSPPDVPAWQEPLHDYLETLFGADRPILINAGTINYKVSDLTANIASKAKPWSHDVLVEACVTNDYLNTSVAQLTTDQAAFVTAVTTTTNWANGKLPRQFLSMGGMCVGGNGGGEDWTHASATPTDDTILTLRNAVLSASASSNSWGYADPHALWMLVDGGQTSQQLFTKINGVSTALPVITPLNPSHLTQGFRVKDGTHPLSGGALLWSYSFLSQCDLRTDAFEPGA